MNPNLSEDMLTSLALIAVTELADGRLLNVDVQIGPVPFLWKVETQQGDPVVILSPRWERLPRIERLEVLTYCLLRCSAALKEGVDVMRLKVYEADLHRVCRQLGICRLPVQTIARRFEMAGMDRLNDQHTCPIDSYEDRERCIICHKPVGSWDNAFEYLHSNCVYRMRRAKWEDLP